MALYDKFIIKGMTCYICLQWFESIDLNKDGLLDATELQRALAVGNLHFSLVTVAHMIRCTANAICYFVLSMSHSF